MQINIKTECKYDYVITLKVDNSTFLKIRKIVKYLVFQIIDDELIGGSYFLVELTVDQLTHLLNYFLIKEENNGK